MSLCKVATNDHKIHAISRRLLDPRRPKRKPTSEEQEEMLIEYDPVIPDDPKQVISHKYEASSFSRYWLVERNIDIDLLVRLLRFAELQRRRRC